MTPNDAIFEKSSGTPVDRSIFRTVVEIVFVCLISTVRLFPVVFSFLTLTYFRFDKDFATLAETSLILLSAANATSFVAGVVGEIYYRRKKEHSKTFLNSDSTLRSGKVE